MSFRISTSLRKGGKSTATRALRDSVLRPALIAADQVACEFDHGNRLAFLVQAIQREYPAIDTEAARQAAKRYTEGEA